MAKQAAEAVSRPSCKAELEEVIEEFERASEALPPDEHALHSWMQRARDLRSRALASNELGRNKLLLKIRAFRMRIWAMRADRRQYRTQRAELGFSSPSESIWEQAPTQLTHQRRHKLSLAIASSWQQGSAQQPPISWIRPKILQPTSKQEEDSAATALANTSSQHVESAPEALNKSIPKKERFHSRNPSTTYVGGALPDSSQPFKSSRSIRLDQISAVVGRLARPGSFEEAREIALDWLRGKRFKIAKSISENFELSGPVKGDRVVATGLGNVWAMQAETADTSLEGRRWRVELVLIDATPTPAVSVTLTAISLANQPAPTPSVPALVSKLINGIGLLDVEAGEILSASPIEVDRPDVLQRLLTSLHSPLRRRPAIVLSTYLKNGKRATLLDPEALAKRLRGIAKVYVLSRGMTWALTDALSKRFAVAGASVRLFRPGFTPDDDPNRHPSWAPNVLTAYGMDLNALSILFEREAADSSLRALEQEDNIPPFDRVREAVLRMQIKEARRQASAIDTGDRAETARLMALQTALDDETKLREMFEEDNEAHRQEISRLRKERDDFIEEKDSWRAREYFLENRIRELGNIAATQENVAHQSFPDNWDHLEEWCSENLGDCVAVTPKAIRAARDSFFENIPLCYDVLRFLADTYVPSRRGTLVSGTIALESEKARLGIDISPVGRAAEAHHSKETYSTTYRGVRVNLDMHVKGSSGRDPRKGFRLYFHWHEETQRVIVGWFPSHLDNDLS
jgi:hypothetical protein